MIDGNVIKFGYGTVAVANNYSDVVFTAIKPPQEVGRQLQCTDELEYDYKTRIKISMAEHYHELKEKLKAVLQINDSCVVTVAGYTFDFSNFNPISVEVILDHATYAYHSYIRLCAV